MHLRYLHSISGYQISGFLLCIAALNDLVWMYAMNYNPETGRREIAEEICTDYEGVDDFNLTGTSYKLQPWEEPLPYPVRPGFSKMSGTHIKARYPRLEGQSLHRRYLRLAPREIPLSSNINDFRCRAFAVSGNFIGKYNCPDNFLTHLYHRERFGFVRNLAPDEGYISCSTVSEELDRYLKECYQKQRIQESSDLSMISAG